MRAALGLVLVVAVACGAGAHAAGATLPLHPECDDASHWDGTHCATRDLARAKLDDGAAALAAFDVSRALPLLEAARAAGPHVWAEHARIYEQLGIAYAYLGDDGAARRAFGMLLSLDPAHLLSYTLSPKATFVFERVRGERATQPVPAIDISWPRVLDVSRPIPLELEVVADPAHFLARAALHVRRKGETRFEVADVALPPPGQYRTLLLPAQGGARPEVVQLYLTAEDRAGNEVLRWGDPARPRELALGYERPTPWYRKWWVWATIGGAVAVGSSAAVYLVVHQPSDFIGGSFGR